MEACRLLIEAGAKVNAASASRRTPLWTACNKGLREVAALLVRSGSDPYATAAGAESPMDCLRRLGGKAALQLHAELASMAAGADAAGGGAAEGAAVTSGREEGEEGEESEGEEEAGEGEDEEEQQARKVLSAGVSKELLVPSIHPHAIVPNVTQPGWCASHAARLAPGLTRRVRAACLLCHRHCCVNNPGCTQSPCPYICEECCWGVCHACFNKAPKEGAEQAASKDSMAELLFSLSQPKDWEALEGDAEDDDAGDAADDDDDDDGARQNAMWDMALRAKAKEGQLEE